MPPKMSPAEMKHVVTLLRRTRFSEMQPYSKKVSRTTLLLGSSSTAAAMAHTALAPMHHRPLLVSPGLFSLSQYPPHSVFIRRARQESASRGSTTTVFKREAISFSNLKFIAVQSKRLKGERDMEREFSQRKRPGGCRTITSDGTVVSTKR